MRITFLLSSLLFFQTVLAQDFFGSFDRSYYGLGLAYTGTPDGGGITFPAGVAAERYLSERGHFYQKVRAKLAYGNDWFTDYDQPFIYDGFVFGSISSYWYLTPNPGWPVSLHIGGGPGLTLLTEFERGTYIFPTLGFSPGIRVGKQSRKVQFILCYDFIGGFADFRLQKEVVQAGAHMGLSFRLN